MRIFLRNFHNIDRNRFSSDEAYLNAVKKQKQEIKQYRSKVKMFVRIITIIACLFALFLLIYFASNIVKKFKGNSLDFDVYETVLSERNVKLNNEKLYMKDIFKVQNPFTVCIDPGHGGEDSGETLKNEDGEILRSEKNDNMKLANLLKDKLEEYGVNVIMTRTGDTKHSNNERCNFANEGNANLFVSLHRNSDDTDSAKKGIEIYTPLDEKGDDDRSQQTGQYIMDYLNASGISYNGGTHAGSITSSYHDFQINRDTNMSSVLIELGYISNEEDNLLYDLNVERYATAICYGILRSYAPECIPFDTALIGTNQNNNLIFDYEQLPTDSISYSVIPTDSQDFNSYLPKIFELDETFKSYSADFIRQNDNNNVYLSFDVGSDAGNVRDIIEILKQKKIKAVFFVNYTFAVNHPDLINLIIDSGHILGNGSRDYPDKGLPAIEEKEQLTQIIDLHEYVLYNYNYCMSLFRFPNGIYSQKLLAIVNNYQYSSIFWSYSYNDYTELGFSDEDILTSMNDALYSGVIYALRTDSETDLRVLERFIDNAIEKGFNFGEL